MHGDNDQPELEKRMKMAWIIWAAFLFALAVYIIVGHQVRGGMTEPPEIPDFYSTLRPALAVVGLVFLFAIPFIQKIIVRGSIKEETDLTAAGESYQNLPGLFPKYFTALIVAYALSEAIAIYGLVLYLLGGDVSTFYIFTAVSAAGMLYHRPSLNRFRMLAGVD